MTLLQGILLGILQGVAEFLPISSSGHLKVAQKLFGLSDVPILFDVMLHLATLAAVVIYFRRTIGHLFAVLGKWIFRRPPSAPSEWDGADIICGTEERGRRAIVAVIVTTAATGAIGVFTSRLIPDLPISAVCAGFIVTAALLVFSSFLERGRSRRCADSADGCGKKADGAGISPLQALAIGVMQGLGTLPGISRSGSTIAGAQICGVGRAAAGEYSFIVSIPAVFGAFLLELKDVAEVGESVGAAPVALGCAAAFAFGYASLSLLMKIIRMGRLEWFAAYLVPLGIAGIIFL